MSFDFKISLSVCSGHQSPARTFSQGASSMNEWLNDELQELEQEKQAESAKHNTQELIQRQTGRVWENVKAAIQDAAEQMNQIPEFRKRIGGLTCQHAYVDRIEVTKDTYPAIYLTVKRGPMSIDIQRKIVTNGESRRTREQSESLDVALDEKGHPFLRDKEGSPLTIDEAVRYIFRPFLHPELVETPRAIRYS
jgi:hypothetical protein